MSSDAIATPESGDRGPRDLLSRRRPASRRASAWDHLPSSRIQSRESADRDRRQSGVAPAAPTLGRTPLAASRDSPLRTVPGRPTVCRLARTNSIRRVLTAA